MGSRQNSRTAKPLKVNGSNINQTGIGEYPLPVFFCHNQRGGETHILGDPALAAASNKRTPLFKRQTSGGIYEYPRRKQRPLEHGFRLA